MVLVEERTSARASVFGAKPTAAIASSTARTVSGETFRVLLRTCETVVTDTPARFATSIIVAKMRSAGGRRLPPPPIWVRGRDGERGHTRPLRRCDNFRWTERGRICIGVT